MASSDDPSLPAIVVEEAFVARGPGVLVMPRFVVENAPRAAISVRLDRPDGTSTTTRALVEIAHMKGAGGTFAMLRLPDLTVAEVPPGTRIALA